MRIVITPREAAQLLGVSLSTVHRAMNRGEIDFIQLGPRSRKLIPKAPFLRRFGL